MMGMKIQPHEMDINKVGDKWRLTEKKSGRELGSFTTREEAVLKKVAFASGRGEIKKSK
jgi:hypothetical protein